MKKKDVLLLAHLRKNARVPLTALARLVGCPVSTIFDRIKGFSVDVVLRHTALVSFKALGFSTVAHILLKADQSKKQDLIAHLQKCWFVNNLYRVNNSWDVICECVFRDLRDAEEFVEGLEVSYALVKKEIHYVLEEVKRESFLSDPDTAELVFDGVQR